MYLLDTDTLSLFQRGNVQINLRRREHDPNKVFASVINVEEQLSGWYKKLRDAKTAPQEGLLSWLRCWLLPRHPAPCFFSSDNEHEADM